MNTPFKMELEDVITEFSSNSDTGLSEIEAKKRLARYGPNKLTEKKKKTFLSIMLGQLKEVLVLVLIGAAAISVAVHEYIDAAVIMVIVVLNTVLGIWQELKAEKSMEALKKISVPKVRVKRDGTEKEIGAKELVPGDIMFIETGNIIAADGRLIESSNLKIQESALTGESIPVEKNTVKLSGEHIPVGDRKNMVHMGTVITYGRGTVLVTGTGMKTELGNIAAMLQKVEDETTPLQKRLAGAGKTLSLAALLLIALVAVITYFRGFAVKEIFMTSISMAVAAIPEGMPAVVTIALALGAQRMFRKNALIRHLPAVETLGSVTVICSDKTGTLTQNRMAVIDLELPDASYTMNDLASRQEHTTGIDILLAGGALCNDAVMSEPSEGNEPSALGDPTEGALVLAAYRIGIAKDKLEKSMPRIRELPFDSDRKRMTTVHSLESIDEKQSGMIRPLLEKTGASHVAFSKGSVDGLMDRCDRTVMGGKIVPLIERIKDEILKKNSAMAENGIRVLGVAFRALPDSELDKPECYESNLVYIGMAGMIDPVRPEVKDAVADCLKAGIRPIMITGDHPLTASFIARDLGIAEEKKYITGQDLANLSIAELKEHIKEVSVFARVSPEHKMKIIDALQEDSHIVAMTGDGVNDAPALKSADIGVAMGITGTDVSRESSDMVLVDDNFATIVAAVKEGRTIYDNIRKFIRYILSGNIGEIFVMLVGPLLGMPMPLRPIQILWINLVTDGAPAVALGYEPSEPDTMKRPPYPPDEGIFARGVGRMVLIMGLIVGSLSLGIGYIFFNKSNGISSAITGTSVWQTMIFSTLTFCQIAFAYSSRSNKKSIFSTNPLSNLPMLFAVLLTVLLQLMLIYIPFFNEVFRTVPLSGYELGICFSAGAVVIAVVEFAKLLGKKKIN